MSSALFVDPNLYLRQQLCYDCGKPTAHTKADILNWFGKSTKLLCSRCAFQTLPTMSSKAT